MNIAACAAANISKRSPSTTTRSGCSRAEGIGEADDAEADGFRDADAGVAAEQRLDALVDLETLVADGVEGVAELRREMHAGGDELKLQARRLADRAHRPDQQAEIGAAAGDEADLARGTSFIADLMLALLGGLISRRSIDSAVARSPRGLRANIGSLCIKVQTGRAPKPASLSAASTSSRRSALGFVEQDRVQPVIARRVLRLAREMDAGNVRKGALIGRGRPCACLRGTRRAVRAARSRAPRSGSAGDS